MVAQGYYYILASCLFVWVGVVFSSVDTDAIREKLVLLNDTSSMSSSSHVKASSMSSSYVKVTRDETENPQSDTRPIVFLHVGPHKTGTTTIQNSFDSNPVLQKDNYRYLGMRNPPPERDSFGVRTSLRQFRAKKSPLFIKKLKTAMSSGDDLIVSAEDFCVLLDAVDENGVNFFTLLATALQESNRQVHVAVGYRRYYEWLISLYNQRHRTKRSQESFVKFYRQHAQARQKPFSQTNMSLRVWKEMQNYFRSVSIINMHDPRDIMTQVYCDILPNATNTCESHKKQLEVNASESTRANPSIPLWPIRIEKEARRRGFVTGAETNLQERIVKFANETNYTLPLICISPKEQEDILQISLRHEQALVPEFFASPLGELELRKGFQQALEDNSFCSVDVAQIFDDKQWLDFFNAS